MLGNILLGLLSGGEGLTGYEMKGRMENGVSVLQSASFGSLYPALRRLEEREYVRFTEEAGGGRGRKIYTITEAGQAVFREWLVSPPEAGEGMNNHLARIYFFDLLPREDRKLLMMEYEGNIAHKLHRLLALEREQAGRSGKDEDYYRLSPLYYGITTLQETLRWCRHVRKGRPLKDLLEQGSGPQRALEEKKGR